MDNISSLRYGYRTMSLCISDGRYLQHSEIINLIDYTLTISSWISVRSQADWALLHSLTVSQTWYTRASPRDVLEEKTSWETSNCTIPYFHNKIKLTYTLRSNVSAYILCNVSGFFVIFFGFKVSFLVNTSMFSNCLCWTWPTKASTWLNFISFVPCSLITAYFTGTYPFLKLRTL